MDIKERIGKHIKDLRTNKGLTQEKLSYESDVDKTYISEVENGKRNISVVNLEKLITTLGSTVKDFFNHEDFE
ncbi:helix-turn-helix transcriptional regulator [Sphingobacterium sp. UT-1RO-CII-1]|uniref:helix-turn-helix domain-containing protein n=1 Tax=Sphingobacterium sp. UT-1RO-CII-1 TaxID=2995225 RepID=UPI00227C5C2C|nr:helix-turn-helix transcriptional regulator [Sphingobacterium sp. UT-1RO-CII-1]MCY4780368.1 helix-turn-helix transcriptional regulator [Sphingobacterium sp. UT-1RO-CII-1]